MTIQTSAQILTDLRVSLITIITSLNDTVAQSKDAYAKTSNGAFYGEEDAAQFEQYIAKMQDTTTTVDGFVQLLSEICVTNARQQGSTEPSIKFSNNITALPLSIPNQTATTTSTIAEDIDMATLQKLQKMGMIAPIKGNNLNTKHGSSGDAQRLATLLAQVPFMNDDRLKVIRAMHKDEPEVLAQIDKASESRGKNSPMKEMMDSLAAISNS